MSSNDLFTNSQYGFRPGRSCVTQLLEVLDDWSVLKDNGISIDIMYTLPSSIDLLKKTSIEDSKYNPVLQTKL
jgi:hypothetical protein